MHTFRRLTGQAGVNAGATVVHGPTCPHHVAPAPRAASAPAAKPEDARIAQLGRWLRSLRGGAEDTRPPEPVGWNARVRAGLPETSAERFDREILAPRRAAAAILDTLRAADERRGSVPDVPNWNERIRAAVTR